MQGARVRNEWSVLVHVSEDEAEQHRSSQKKTDTQVIL